jgi:uracil-DNA glycosylase
MNLGSQYLQWMITLFQPRTVIAVGNVAFDTLTGMGFLCAKVRHPAQGGKSAFVAGMKALLG